MKFRLITLGAMVTLAALSSNSQTPASAPSAPNAVTAAPSTGVTPRLPNGDPQRQGLEPNQLTPNTGSQTAAANNTTTRPNLQDSGLTAADQNLLGQVRQMVVLRVPGAGHWAPVHFQVQSGIVTLIGSVPDATVRQQIEAAVMQTPGVVSVVNQLGANSTEQTAIETAAANNSRPVMSPVDQGLLLRVRQL